MARFRNPIALLAGALLLTACGDSVEVTDLGKLEKPAQHDAAVEAVEAPPATVERQVVVPAEVAKKFTAVKLTMMRGAESKPQTFTQTLGTTQTHDGVTLLVRDYLPAFYMDNNSVSTQGSEESNPALWVEASAANKLLFKGWLFRDYPELNPPEEQGFELRLLGAVEANAKEGQ